MKFLQTIFSLFVLPTLFFVSGVEVVQAQTPTVVFEATPLFLNADVLPGDAESRTVTVTNGSPDTHDVYVSVDNVFSTGLAEVMSVEVTSPASTHFSGLFEAFFTATPIDLGALAPGTSRTYTFSASLPEAVGNAYQEKQLGFDLIIGFVGGGQVNDNPGGNGGGGGGGVLELSIFNEEVDAVNGNTASLTWNTNLNATTYLVCGLLDGEPFVLTATPPLFGYEFVLPESETITKVHTGDLTGLDIGTYECRPAGRVSPSKPFTVGQALRFTIGPDGAVAGVAISAPAGLGQAKPFAPTGSVLGASGKGMIGGPTYDEWKAELEAEKKAKAEALLETASTTNDSTLGVSNKDFEDRGDESSTENVFAWYWGLWLLFILGVIWYWRYVSLRR